MYIGTMAIDIFGYIWCFFTEIFGMLFSFHILSDMNNLKVKVGTEFPNVWGEYNSNPIYRVLPYPVIISPIYK